jgi:hypothetical protein
MKSESKESDLIDSLRSYCMSLRAEQEIVSSFIAAHWLSGDLRSNFLDDSGLEKDISDVFRIGDNPETIDHRRPPAFAAAYGWGAAVARGAVRKGRYVRHVDAQLIVIMDLSRSMLTGWFDRQDSRDSDNTEKRYPKLDALFMATSALGAIAERAGFRFRTVGAKPGKEQLSAPGRTSDVRYAALANAQDELLDSLRVSNRNPQRKEPWALAGGIEPILHEVRTPCVVVVLSDFLDPLSTYETALGELALRHQVLLVDLAARNELHWPDPGGLGNLRSRETGRHVELGTVDRPIFHGLDFWNKLIDKQRTEWEEAVQMLRVPCINFRGGNTSLPAFVLQICQEAIKFR